MDGSSSSKKVARLMGLFFGGVVLTIGLIHYGGDSDDVIENLLTFFKTSSLEQPVTEKPLTASAPEAVTEKVTLQEVEDNPPIREEFSADVVENPYVALSNILGPHPNPMNGVWTPALEVKWRNGLDHEFTYQHYKTVKGIREKRLDGSEILLYQALSEVKFWTRMEAIIALSEFGYAVSLTEVKGAVGNARSSLIKNYLSRFYHDQTPGIIYILKQIIKFADAPSRLVILKILKPLRQQENRIYLLAATYDKSPVIQKWLASVGIYQSSFSFQMITDYQKLVMNHLKGSDKAVDSEMEEKSRVVNSQAGSENLEEEIAKEIQIYEKDLLEIDGEFESDEALEQKDNAEILAQQQEKVEKEKEVKKDVEEVVDDGFIDLGGREVIQEIEVIDSQNKAQEATQGAP